MIRSKHIHDRLVPIGALCALYAAACGSDSGSNCSVTDQHDGTYDLSCDGQDTVTLQGAPSAEDAGTCSVEQSDGGGATIRCPDGTEVSIAAQPGAKGDTGAAGTACSVQTVDGGASVSCDDGTKATIADGAGCDVKQEVSGDFTVTCGQDQVVLPGPGSDASCHVTYIDGAAMLNCDDGSSVAIGQRQLPTLIMGANVACALAIDGEVVCWGDGTSIASPLAGGRYVRLIGNRNGSTFCAMDAAGDVDCWGRNDTNQTVVPNETFRTAEWLSTHSLCGITLDDRVVCWPSPPSPAILKADDDYSKLDLAALGSACLIRNSDQQVECRKADNVTDVTLSMPPGQYVDVAVSGFDSPKVCAVTTDHVLRCNDGSSDTTEAGDWTRIEPLDSGFCGLLVDGSISCFDTYSEITSGIPEGNDFVDLQTSNQAVCAVRASGSVVCWSRNSDGLTGVPAALR